MANHDGMKALVAAMVENLGPYKPPKAGDPCPSCGRPFERLGYEAQEPFVCCPHCENRADGEDDE